jgi:hypothetical protein
MRVQLSAPIDLVSNKARNRGQMMTSRFLALNVKGMIMARYPPSIFGVINGENARL